MPVKPILMSDIRKSAPADSPAKAHRLNVGAGNYNRFGLLLNRDRSLSTGKRPRQSEEEATTAPKIIKLDSNKVFEQLASHDKHLDVAKEALGRASAAMAAVNPADPTGTALSCLIAAVNSIVLHGEAMKSTMVDMCKALSSGTVANPAVAPPKKAAPTPGTPSSATPSFASAAAKTKQPTRTPQTEAESAAHKVKKVLREAERRTVLFELDLGPAPIINKETISRKVTMALHGKASEGNHDWNIKDAGEMVDDVLSCSQLEFLGSGTRKFFNNRSQTDPRNGKMCTVPIRMDFKNKDTRIRAESTLKGICKVNCSVPYPKKLRAMIRDTIAEGKKIHKESFIKTKVDIDNLRLSALAKIGGSWTSLGLDKVIPLDILDRNTIIPDEDTMETVENPQGNQLVQQVSPPDQQVSQMAQQVVANTPLS